MTWCFEPLTGELFLSEQSQIDIINAWACLYANAFGVWQVPMNDVLALLGVCENKLYDNLAFELPRTEETFELITLEDGVTDMGTPCLVLNYLVEPDEVSNGRK